MKHSLSLSFTLLFLGLLSSIVVGHNLNAWFPHRPTVPDLSFLLLPYLPQAGIIADLISLVSLVLLIPPLKHNWRQALPLISASLGLMYTLRSLLILATPLGPSSGTIEYQALFNQVLQLDGNFPSGHIAFVSLPYFLNHHRWFKNLALTLTVLEALALLLARGHYTIDLVGGVVLMALSLNASKRLLSLKDHS